MTINTKNYIVLDNIVCRDADGKVFEQYPEILVSRDIERDGQKQINHTPYQWVKYFEDKGLFLPSFALSCNILATLYSKRSDAEINKVLMQYKDHGSGYGWHAQNTIINWNDKKIIHYPKKDNFPAGSVPINLGRGRREYPFNPEGFDDLPLDKALKASHFEKYIRDLTGLDDPQILIEMGKYFGRPAKIWVPNNPAKANYTGAVWLGWLSDSFGLVADGSLDYGIAARGVRAAK